MSLTPTRELIPRGRTAVGAFNAVSLEQVEAILDGAGQAGLPVIVQISENAVDYHGALAPLAAAALAAIKDSKVPVALHLDHATRLELIKEAVDMGFTSVMYDGAHLSWEQNVKLTRETVRWCHERGVLVEAELGEVGGKNGAHTPGVRTDPGQAARFVADTGVDALAVAVGTSHHMTVRDAAVDLDLVRRLREAVAVPLVLHGSSGAPDATLAAAAAVGMRKVNVATHLNAAFTGSVRAVLAADGDCVDPRAFLRPARAAMAEQVAHLLRLLAAPALLSKVPRARTH
ncbi:class II fructose-bisphosphate aldolase [Streptomyces collinus]|uniref:class II fructose-bisphosphate aldolase n=1 Tax=Streptomyces collinus TaxID=42684 RepID=UPI0036C221B9